MSRWDRRIALAAAAIGVILLLIGAGQLVVDRQVSSGTSFTLIGGIALLILSALIDPRAALELAHNRRTRFGSMSVVISAVMVGVLVMLNLIASRSLAAADTTRAGYYTLSGQTLAVLNQLDSQLTVTGFYRFTPQDTPNRHNEQTLMALYAAASPKVSVRFVDPDVNYGLSKQLGVTIAGSLVLQYKNKPPLVLTPGSETEQDVTSAILKLESNKTPLVCWAIGDGERNLKSTDTVSGYSLAAGQLLTSNFKLSELALGTVTAVPPDCDILAIVAPGRPLSGAAPALVADYLAHGGKLLVAADSLQPPVTDSLNTILKPYGAAFEGGLVIDADANHHAGNQIDTAVAVDFGQSPISNYMSGRFAYFPQPTAINITSNPAVTATQLVATTTNSYEITNTNRPSVDRQPGDKPGAFTMMETLEQRQDQGRVTRIAVVGTAGLAQNEVLPPVDKSNASNQQLFLSTMDWLSQQEALISVPPKPSRAIPVPVTEADKTLNIVVAGFLMPLTVAGLGLLVWLRRRRTRQ